ncbi:MAG: DNA polymerase III subunit delta, partial [Thermodesulfobacteriota bacterium]
MALIKRTELSELLRDPEKGERKAIYLFFGERYLCREAADQLQKTLLAYPCGGAVHVIDGDTEDAGKSLGRLMNFSLLPGLQIFRVTDTRLFHSKDVASAIWSRVMEAHDAKKEAPCRRQLLSFIALGGLTPEDRLAEIAADQWRTLFGFARPDGDLAWADAILASTTGQKGKRGVSDIGSAYLKAFEKGIPPNNILILSAEAVDKRKQLFKFIKNEGLVVDCSVAAGASAAAQKNQKEVLRGLVLKSLATFQKKMAPRALELLFERVGFHPVAVVMETEKLALGVGDRDLITAQDLEAMVGRTREDALFELTDAFGKRQVARTLVLLNRLQENGMHSLAILATMRNYLRKLLVFRSLQSLAEPVYHSSMSAQQFQKEYLPALKERGEWSDMLKGHPYGLYMSFTKAREFSCPLLKEWLTLLLQAEYRLKGAPLPPRLVLEELFLTMLTGKTEG